MKDRFIKSVMGLLLFAVTVFSVGFKIGISQVKTVEKEVIQYVEVAAEDNTEKETENEPELISLGMFTATAYCPCEKCCGKYALSRPIDESGNPIVYTASGERAVQGVTIAADTSVLPFGTKVYINGHEYIVHDRGGAIKGNRIDVYFATHTEALAFGKQELEVFVWG